MDYKKNPAVYQQGQKTHLVELPNEVIREIAQLCSRQRRGGLKELSLVNKFFRQHCMDLCFRNVKVEGSNAQLLDSLQQILPRRWILRAVRTIRIRMRENRPAGEDFTTALGHVLACLPNLTELDMRLHQKDMSGISRRIRGEMLTFPHVTALRIKIPGPVSLAFIVRAFPILEKFAFMMKKGSAGPATLLRRRKSLHLDKLQSLGSLKSFQLEQYSWDLEDLRYIRATFPFIERLSLVGPNGMSASAFVREIYGWDNLRHLSLNNIDLSFWRLNIPQHGVKIGWRSGQSEYVVNTPYGTLKDADYKFGFGDSIQITLAVALMGHPTLGYSLDSVFISGRSGDPAPRLFTRCMMPAVDGILTRVNIERDYGWDMAHGGPGDFWYYGALAFMEADREWFRR